MVKISKLRKSMFKYWAAWIGFYSLKWHCLDKKGDTHIEFLPDEKYLSLPTMSLCIPRKIPIYFMIIDCQF